MRVWPAGEYARFQPRTAEFQRAVGEDVRGALEAALARHSALTQGDWIRVPFAGQDFDLLVQKTRPGKAVSVIGPCPITNLTASCSSLEVYRRERATSYMLRGRSQSIGTVLKVFNIRTLHHLLVLCS